MTITINFASVPLDCDVVDATFDRNICHLVAPRRLALYVALCNAVRSCKKYNTSPQMCISNITLHSTISYIVFVYISFLYIDEEYLTLYVNDT